jgi:ribonuclease BN (tRNA processing enzyme)
VGIGAGGGALSRHGWGHSTIDAAIATGMAARARHLHLGHHEPKRTDKELDEVAQLAQRLSELELRRQGRAATDCRTCLAAEGMEIEI